MMSKRDSAIAALFSCIEASAGTTATVQYEKDEVVVKTKPIVQLDDGDMGEPEVTLGAPVMYHVELTVNVTVFVKKADISARRAVVSGLLAQLSDAIAADVTLGGVVDDSTTGVPEYIEFERHQLSDASVVQFPVTLHYSTSNLLN